jgi:hypothetical protein
MGKLVKNKIKIKTLKNNKMKKNILILLVAFFTVQLAQAQKTKKKTNNAVAVAATEENKDWKPTKGDTRNPFDSIKTKKVKVSNSGWADDGGGIIGGKKPVKANGLSEGDDPFGKSGARRKQVSIKKNGYANQEVMPNQMLLLQIRQSQ